MNVVISGTPSKSDQTFQDFVDSIFTLKIEDRSDWKLHYRPLCNCKLCFRATFVTLIDPNK